MLGTCSLSLSLPSVRILQRTLSLNWIINTFNSRCSLPLLPHPCFMQIYLINTKSLSYYLWIINLICFPFCFAILIEVWSNVEIGSSSKGGAKTLVTVGISDVIQLDSTSSSSISLPFSPKFGT